MLMTTYAKSRVKLPSQKPGEFDLTKRPIFGDFGLAG